MTHLRTFISIIAVLAACVHAHGMRQTDTILISRFDSIPLSITIAEPDNAPKAVVQIVHGMCEHKERYIPFIQFLTDHGYAVIIHDHRGHGASVLSSEDLGYFYSGGYQAMIADARLVGAHIQQRYPDLPFFLFGHSMGSMVVRSYIKTDDSTVDALVVCGSPSYNSSTSIGKCLAKTSARNHGDRYRPKNIQRLSFNSFNRKFRHEGSPNAWICSDTTVVRLYDADPLCNFQFTANGFYNLFSLMQFTYDTKDWKLTRRDMPILFVSGEDDPCAAGKRRFAKAQQSMNKAGYTNVDGTMYPNMRHEILNEKEKETVWNDILRFFDKNM